ncbi:MAG: glycosyltransferase [Blastocatellia bacterium]
MPKISVVVTAINGFPELNRCLKALANQRGAPDAEVIVVGSALNGLVEYVTVNFPGVKVISREERVTIPELRATGMSRAAGEIVAITEDRCVPAENWLKAIDKAHQSEYEVVGGAVEPDDIEGILNWAVYLCEYSSLMLPVPEGEVAGVAGNNSSYRREALNRVSEKIKNNYWESFLHEELRRNGVKILFTPWMLVSKNIDFTLSYFLGQRFHYSRSFAGMRGERATMLQRLIYAAMTPGLPLLMTLRIARQVFQKRRRRKEFLLSLPLLAAFMASYAAGEFVGYLSGPGRSLLKVE